MSQVKLYVYAGGRASFVATGVSIPAQWWSADAQAVSARAIGAEALNAQLRDVLDIARDTIAHALGHGGNTVTDIYIDFDQSKVDDANRRVLDWVLYGRR